MRNEETAITARIAPPESNTGTPISVMPTTCELAEWSKPSARIFCKCEATLFSPPVKTMRHGPQESAQKRSPARSASRLAEDSTKQVHRLKHQTEAAHYPNQARTNGRTRDTTMQTRRPPATWSPYATLPSAFTTCAAFKRKPKLRP